MKSFQQNERYPYSAIGHAAVRDGQGRYYCRAIRTLREDNYVQCMDCPLHGGETKDYEGSGETVPECWYYDLDLQDSESITPEELYNREEALIQGKLIPEFPYFIADFTAERKFGILEDAIQFAARAHAGQVRKGSSIPYICHPIEVMMLTARMSKDPEVAAAAALHDTLEDTDTTEEDIRRNFGDRILEMVKGESEDKRPHLPAHETWKLRKEESLKRAKTAPIEHKIIMLADKLSNIRSTYREYQKMGDLVFERFNVKDKESHAWYERGCLDALSELKDLPQYSEYAHLVSEIYH